MNSPAPSLCPVPELVATMADLLIGMEGLQIAAFEEAENERVIVILRHPIGNRTALFAVPFWRLSAAKCRRQFERSLALSWAGRFVEMISAPHAAPQ